MCRPEPSSSTSDLTPDMPAPESTLLPHRRQPAAWAITGATGLVGNNLARRLIARGDRVRVLARGRARRELEGLPCEVVEGDLQDEGALRRCFVGADVVVHAAASVWVGVTGREEAQRVNVDGTAAVCRAMPADALLLHVSSVDALGLGTRARPATEDTAPRAEEGGVPYVDTKRAADVVVRASGRPHVLVHPTYMIGPWDWRPSSSQMVLEVARGKARVAPRGGNNFVHVADVCAGMIAAAERAPEGSAWILGNENLSYREAWTRIAAVVGAAPPLGELPPWLGAVAAGALAIPLRLGAPEGTINPATVRMGFLPHYFDPSRARAALGLPATPIEDAVQEAWAWFQARGYR